MATKAQLIADIEAEEAAIEAERVESILAGRESLDDFSRRMSPHLIRARHLEKLQDLFRRARHEPVRACISMPPRHGKSVTIQHALAQWIKDFPADTCAYASYSDRIAWSQSRKIRRLARRAGVELADEAAAVAEWRTEQGGGLLACGTNGALTGQGVTGVMVIDDPYKNREEADSPVMREKVWDFITEVAETRLEDASMIVNHTRWHMNDAIAELVEEHGWEYINLPAIAENDNDPMGRAIGEALWPEKFPVEVLNRKKALNEFSFAALYQGRPRPKGHAVFQGVHYYDPAKTDLTGCMCIIGGDPAASEKTHADYSAIVALGLKWKDGLPWVYVLDVYRKQVQVPQFVRDAIAFQRRNHGAAMWVEAVAGFKAVPQMLLDVDPQILVQEITHPEGDKFVRSQALASAWNAGRVLVPMGSPPWLKAFVDEFLRFTGVKDKHDDQVDAAAHAFNAFIKAEAQGYRGAVAAAHRWGA